MRTPFLPALLLCLIAGCQKPPSKITLQSGSEPETVPSGPSQSEGNDARVREILNRAVSAYGGSAAREKLKTCRVVYRTTIHMPQAMSEIGDDVAVTEDHLCHPDQLRRTVCRETDKKRFLLSVVSGDRMWLVSGDGAPTSSPCPPGAACPAVISALRRIMELRDSGHGMRLESEEEHDGKKVVPLTVILDGIPRSTTYFDESSGLPVREVKQVVDASNPPESLRRTALAETTYDDYRPFEGVVLPTKIRASQAGRLMMEVELLEVEFPESLPSELFDPLTEDNS